MGPLTRMINRWAISIFAAPTARHPSARPNGLGLGAGKLCGLKGRDDLGGLGRGTLLGYKHSQFLAVAWFPLFSRRLFRRWRKLRRSGILNRSFVRLADYRGNGLEPVLFVDIDQL